MRPICLLVAVGLLAACGSAVPKRSVVVTPIGNESVLDRDGEAVLEKCALHCLAHQRANERLAGCQLAGVHPDVAAQLTNDRGDLMVCRFRSDTP